MFKDKHLNYNTFPSSSTNSNDVEDQDEEPPREWLRGRNLKNIVSFWLLGIGTDFGYWIILTAAHDLLSETGSIGNVTISPSGRECNQLSTGVVLIANVVPNLLIKLVLPFLPLWINARTFVAIVFSIVGFSLAASNQTEGFLLSGVALCSLAVGIWTSSYLMYLPNFKDENVIKAWCSGCGTSGFLASFTYVALTTAEIRLKTILTAVMVIPLIMALVFWFLLEQPKETKEETEFPPAQQSSSKFVERVYVVCRLLFFYTTPYFLVFFSQYLINQGLYELINFKNSIFTLATQVRVFVFVYLLSTLISTTFIHFRVNFLYLLALIQVTNLSVMTTESIYGWMGDSRYIFWIVVALICWEGLVAGASYVNTYRRINDEIPDEHRKFAMSFNSIGASLGMLVAGVCAVPLHNFICDLPPT